MNIQDLNITAAQMKNLIIAILNVDSQDSQEKSKNATKNHDKKIKDKTKYEERNPKTKVESDTGKRPEKDTNPLPPNPNKVDNHED